MNWDTIEGIWKEVSGRAKAKWSSINGRRDEVVGLVQKRYGHARDVAEREVDDWLRDF